MRQSVLSVGRVGYHNNVTHTYDHKSTRDVRVNGIKNKKGDLSSKSKKKDNGRKTTQDFKYIQKEIDSISRKMSLLGSQPQSKFDQSTSSEPFHTSPLSPPSYSSPSYFSNAPQQQQRSRLQLFFPKNAKQEEYRNMLMDEKPHIVVATGPAGTSKTLCATMVGIEKLLNKEIKKLVITRPAVSADEDLGFLPGSLSEKMWVWLLPIIDSLSLYLKSDEIDTLMKSKDIEICALSHMRGRTFRDSYVLIDECQNTTQSQMLMLLTRIGNNSKFVFTGDLKQHDRKNGKMSGLEDFVIRFSRSITNIEVETEKKRSILPYLLADLDGSENENESESEGEGEDQSRYNMVEMVHFEDSDVVRHPVIPKILSLYENDSFSV